MIFVTTKVEGSEAIYRRGAENVEQDEGEIVFASLSAVLCALCASAVKVSLFLGVSSYDISASAKPDVRCQTARAGIGQLKHPAHALDGFLGNCQPQPRPCGGGACRVTPEKRAGQF